ncbi:MAG: hypothetical protein GTN84_02630 [Hydrogenophaga sp.]|uniref:hypothetical protein n=1 Tax=Hydrogenophaga sp. TaxID=1904254 RepID=UPI00169516F4|nr:hypothetical protein [Hydrogenophaga sp.]NIM40050.1 hypothetical protein [Hydrogenophaga sp.]NIN25246.1 hypothetical protein [Hydrogenophaga sp.]NIN29813.1 hypothetical protein [Hydrogenophaga sp.]NIN54285.1 hypothetical protein [Hydrogenophaga sp.]NIO50698.1 hypothetical protein [Hydrogenophaga sp.]
MPTESPLCLHEARAAALRAHAMADFWRDADAVWARMQRDAAARLARSSQRLHARLRQHGAGRRQGA